MGLTRPRAYQIFDIDYKQSVRVVTVSNVTLSGGAPSQVDGVSLSQNDRVLVTGQSTASQNGIYYVSQVGVAGGGGSPWILTRATDGNKYGQKNSTTLGEGAYFLITGGDDAGEAYVCNVTGTIVFGTTNITFAQFSQVQPIQAGNGLGAFSTSTRHIRQLAAIDNFLW